MPPSKILVVEDEPDIRELICQYLQRCGHEVISAATGAEGMWSINNEFPHLLLTDKNLPDCLGFELIEKIRNVAIHSTIKSVLITADITAGGSEFGKPDSVLLKPFALRQLGAIVDELLQEPIRVSAL